jgi:hypothetical protein
LGDLILDALLFKGRCKLVEGVPRFDDLVVTKGDPFPRHLA